MCEENNKEKYFVYCHTNKINSKKYIGITSLKKPEYRWGVNGYGYRFQNFYKAIKKYGWSNFEHEILYSNLTQKDAFEKEIELIEKYKTNQKEFGYNISVGGEASNKGLFNNSLSTKVYQYSLDGSFIKEFPSMMEAERETGISNSLICACCKNKHMFTKKYIWSYEKFDKIEKIDLKEFRQKIVENCKKKVYKYDLEGNFVEEYSSLTEASEKNNINLKNISDCCRGKMVTSNNFMWFYDYKGQKTESRSNRIKKDSKGVKIKAYKNGVYIDTFNSISEAGNKLDICYSSIQKILKNKKEIKGYYFEKF